VVHPTVCGTLEGLVGVNLESTDVIDVEHRDHLSVFHMRHGKANALDTEFCQALTARLEEHRNSATGALILTGHGQIFSAGVDLLRVLDGGPNYLTTFLPALCTVFETLFCFPKPVIAAINGHAIAGGCVLACAADYRVMAAQRGRIGVPELLVGVPFPSIALEIMRSVTAPHHLPALLYSGTTFDAAQALERGLVDALVASHALMEQAVTMAGTLTILPPSAFALTKQQIRMPFLRRAREDGARFDVTVQELWEAPTTLTAIRAYVARTFKRSS
jgi:enoyl-CoA hydratase